MRLLKLLKRDLAAEASDWVADGLISRDQGQAILERYDIELVDGRRTRRAGIELLAAVAAMLVGVGLVVLLGANWEEIPRTVRLAVIVSSLIAAKAGAIALFRRGRDVLGQSLLIVSVAVFGVAIFLVAQMFHLGEHYPSGILLWTTGALLTGLVARSTPVMLLSGVLGVLWMFTEQHLGGTALGFPVLVAALLAYALWAKRSVAVLLLAVMSLSVWSEASLLRIDASGLPLLAFVVLAIAGARLFADALERTDHAWHDDYGLALRAWTSRLLVFALVPLSFSGVWKELYRLSDQHFAAVIAGVAVVLALLSAVWTPRWSDRLPSVVFAAGIVAFGAVLAIPSAKAAATVGMVLTSLSLVGVGAGLIVSGVSRGSGFQLQLGIWTIVVTALCRYVELVGDYVGTAAVFIGSGVAIFAVAKVWSLRERDESPEVRSGAPSQEATHA